MWIGLTISWCIVAYSSELCAGGYNSGVVVEAWRDRDPLLDLSIRQRTGEIERELGRAWASAGHLEHVEVVGDGGGRPERAGDDDPRRRKVVHVGGDLGSIKARVSGRRR